MSLDYEQLSLHDIITILRTWRENNQRRSDEIVDLWQISVADNLHNLGKEKHVILEQIIFAALDCHQFDIVEKCIRTLLAEFSDSFRVHRYHAMKLEAMEKYDDALKILDSLIERDATNPAPRKRRVAIFKARGKIPEAIKELTEYLKKFMSDMEAWQELCELYLNQAEYPRAVFCAEELLLHQPHSHLFHQRVADIRYTMGGIENMELARTYYWQAIKLNGNNMRALYGLFLVCYNLATQYKSGGTSNKKKDVMSLSVWALNNIKSKYKSLGQNVPMLQGPKTTDKTGDPLEGMVGSLSALTMN